LARPAAVKISPSRHPIAEPLKKEPFPIEAAGSAIESPATPPITRAEIAAWVIIALGFLLIFVRDLVPGVVAGLLFFLLLDRTTQVLMRRVSARALRPLALLTGTVVGAAFVTGAIMLILAIVRAQLRNIPALMTRMAEILESTRLWLVSFGGYEFFPEAVRDAEDLKQIVVGWLKGNAAIIGITAETFGLAIVHMVMGLLLAMMVYLRNANPQPLALRGPLARHLTQKVAGVTTAFSQVVVAQVLISAINTTLTAIYLLVALPLADRPLPFSLTMIFITFVTGLIPVVGNLISNTVIVIVSLGVSPGTAIASLVFLVTIHKLEYVVNSRIIGSKTGSQIWEILLAILIGEAAFGVQGMILAPVIYTFAKRELKQRGLV
jgi:predicted PurR-regulated permease PerM